MFVIVCGAGKVGFSLVRQLVQEKHKVVLLDKNRETCEFAAEELRGAIVIQGDACDPDRLEEARIDRADVVVAATGHDEDNLVICQLAKSAPSSPRTVAKVNDPRNEESMARLGVDVPVNASNLIAQVINREASLEEIGTLLKLKQGKISILKGKINGKSALANEQLKNLKLPPKSIIALVLRKDDIIVPKGDTVLEKGDDLLAITTEENEKELLRLIAGE